MRGRIAWILNLDAEFAWLDGAHAASPRLRSTVRSLAEGLRAVMRRRLGEDRVRVVLPALDGSSAGGSERIEVWAATSPARDLVLRLGGEWHAAAPEVAAQVNHRAFAAGLMEPEEFPGACFLTGASQVVAVLRHRPRQPFVLKRPFGFSGRMRKVVVGAELGPAERTWIEASMSESQGGLQVEPLVERELDVALHGLLQPGGAHRFGSPVVSDYDERGAWLGARPARPGELDPLELDALAGCAERVAVALHGAGYHGPFGIDAFRWCASDGSRRFRTLVEINARHTMAGLVAGDLDVLLGES